VHQLEQEMFPVLQRSGLGLLAFSPLDTGHLVPGRPVEKESALAALIQVLDQVATDLGVSRAAVCVAWVLAHSEVTSVLAGAESLEHVEQNLSGARLELPDDAMDALNAASEVFRERYESEKRV
jgi:aryl-alcohol dehydrogenase-like predicted oxidoreductase